MNNDTTPKYVLAIYNCTYRFIYEALKAEDNDHALSEANIKAMKTKNVLSWYVLARENETKKGAAEYTAFARFFCINGIPVKADSCGLSGSQPNPLCCLLEFAN